MSGTKAGGLKAAVTNRKLHGEDFYRRIGRKGGCVSTPTGGFASTDRNKVRECGRKGGTISHRGKAKPKVSTYKGFSW